MGRERVRVTERGGGEREREGEREGEIARWTTRREADNGLGRSGEIL